MLRVLVTALVVATGATAQSSDATLPRLEGTVRNSATGEPVRKAAVIFQKVAERMGQPDSYAVLTDENGHFTFTGFPPGDWIAHAQREGYVMLFDPEKDSPSRWRIQPDTAIKDLTFHLTPTGTLIGRVLDAEGEPVTGAMVQLSKPGARPRGEHFSSAQTNDLGEYRLYHVPPGRYIVSADFASAWRQMNIKLVRPGKGQDSSPEDYLTTYYPSALDPRQATVVTVGAGAQVQGIQIRLLRGGVFRVSGQVTNASSSTYEMLSVNLEAQDPNLGSRRSFGTQVRPDGGFEFQGVPPGRYILRAHASGANGQLSSSKLVEVSEADVAGVQLTLAAPAKISGNVTIEGGSRLPVPALVLLEEVLTHEGVSGQVQPDGSFKFENVNGGNYNLRLAGIQGPDSNLYIKSARFANEDVLSGVKVQGQTNENLEVVLRDDGASVSCNVVNDKGDRVRRARVILVPDEPRDRAAALYGQTWIDGGGACRVRGLAPGSYRALAFPPQSQVDIRRVEDWKPYEKSAKQVQVAAKETATVELRLIPDSADQE